MKDMESKEIISQNIAPPIIVTLNMNEEEYIKEHKEAFAKIGFEIEHFGGKEYSISAIPANLPGKVGKDFFLDILDNLMEGSSHKSDMLLEKIASMSCKAAVKGNNKMSYMEMERLIEELFTLDNPYNCPHGRPTTIAITQDELEKKFKRQV
jgi:DNA mismatch repair protein MutL